MARRRDHVADARMKGVVNTNNALGQGRNEAHGTLPTQGIAVVVSDTGSWLLAYVSLESGVTVHVIPDDSAGRHVG